VFQLEISYHVIEFNTRTYPKKDFQAKSKVFKLSLTYLYGGPGGLASWRSPTATAKGAAFARIELLV